MLNDLLNDVFVNIEELLLFEKTIDEKIKNDIGLSAEEKIFAMYIIRPSVMINALYRRLRNYEKK